MLGLKPLVQNPTHFDLTIHTGDHDWVISRCFPCLENLSCVTDLNLNFDAIETMDPDNLHDISDPVTLSLLAKMPLCTFVLGGGMFGGAVDLATTFPTLTKLEVRHQHVSSYNLSCFATIPKLEHLVISIDLQNDVLACFKDEMPVCTSFRTLEITGRSVVPTDPFWMNEDVE